MWFASGGLRYNIGRFVLLSGFGPASVLIDRLVLPSKPDRKAPKPLMVIVKPLDGLLSLLGKAGNGLFAS